MGSSGGSNRSIDVGRQSGLGGRRGSAGLAGDRPLGGGAADLWSRLRRSRLRRSRLRRSRLPGSRLRGRAGGRFGTERASAADLRRHPRRRARQRRGDAGAGRSVGARKSGPTPVPHPVGQPRRDRSGHQELRARRRSQSKLSRPLVHHRPRARLFPGSRSAVRAREPGGGGSRRTGIRAAVAVHAPLACVNYDGPAARWAEAVAVACGWPARGDIGYPTPGSFGSWLGIDCGLPVLTLELPPGPLAPVRQAARAALDAAISQAPRDAVRRRTSRQMR